MANTAGEYWAIPGLAAGADLSSHQYKVVKFASTAGQVIVSAAAANQHIGVLQNDPSAQGQPAAVASIGHCLALASASITQGAALTSDTTGRVVTTTTDAANLVGWAMETVSNANDLVMIRLAAPSRFNT